MPHINSHPSANTPDYDTHISSFNSQNNISMLWEILVGEGFINMNDIEHIRPTFNEIVRKFAESDYTTDIAQLDKDCLKAFISMIRTSNIHTLQSPQAQHSMSNSQRNVDDFNQRLAQARDDFDKFRQRAQPQPIDFTVHAHEDKHAATAEDIRKLAATRNYDQPTSNMGPHDSKQTHHAFQTNNGTYTQNIGTTDIASL